jgi:hypothetical protein
MLYINQYVLHFIFWKKLDSPPPPLSSPLKGEEMIGINPSLKGGDDRRVNPSFKGE